MEPIPGIHIPIPPMEQAPIAQAIVHRTEGETLPLDLNAQAARIQNLIKDHFDVLHANPPFPAALHKYEGIMLGELHTNPLHAQVNGLIVDFIKKTSNDSILLTEDGAPKGAGQAREVKSDIIIRRWDTTLDRIETAKLDLDKAVINCAKFIDETHQEIKELEKKLLQAKDETEKKNILRGESLDYKSELCKGMSDQCMRIHEEYIEAIDVTLNDRDQHLQNQFLLARSFDRSRKIVLIGGNKHVPAFAQILIKQGIPGIALVSKELKTEVPTLAQASKGETSKGEVEEKDFFDDLNELDMNNLVPYLFKKTEQLKSLPLVHNLNTTTKSRAIQFVLSLQRQYFENAKSHLSLLSI